MAENTSTIVKNEAYARAKRVIEKSNVEKRRKRHSDNEKDKKRYCQSDI